MGVTGLWSLVDSVGHPINLETLHNRVIAIDLSLWVNQSIKGIRGRNGQTVENAHVLGLFNRICKLLFYKIRPVFVFDGKCPELKKNTIAKRAEQRLKAIDKSRQSSIKIIENYIASQLTSSSRQLATSDRLPALESALLDMPDHKSFKIYEELTQMDANREFEEESDDSDYEPKIAHNYRNVQKIESIDVNSDEFKAMPPEIRYEILTEMKQKFKGYRNTDIMPNESNDFSDYQLKRLLRKRGIQSQIENTIKQLNGEQTEDILKELDKKGFSDSELNAGQLVSDENVRFVLLTKSAKSDQSVSSMMTKDNQQKSVTDIDHIPSTSKASTSNQTFTHISDTNASNHSILVITDSSSDSGLDVEPVAENCCNNNKSDPIQMCEPYKPLEYSKDNPVLNAFIFEDVIEISEESDTELNDTVSNEADVSKVEDSKSVNPSEVSNEFTKIKPIEVDVESDSNDDFVEVLPAECNESVNVEPNNSIFDDLDRCSDFSSDSNDNINQEQQEVVKTGENTESIESETIPSKVISREELMATAREMNKQQRFANHVDDQMMADCQELLSLFGIPYVISPTEAEAQCAALEALGLTEGTITDDSDALLFGAQTVYKNFFTSSKYVELFTAKDIETRFGLTRSSLICIALLCGSDYTDGVQGVGTVKATEILSEFPGDGLNPLTEFKNWWQNKKDSKDKRPENTIRAKLMKIKLNESFPNRVIFDAYMNPKINDSTEKFLWGIPRLDELRDYTRLRFGWTLEKCNQILLPIMKKTQMTIDNYFKIQVQQKDNSIVSKRINKAVNKLKGIDSESVATGSQPKSSALSQKVKNQRKKRKTADKPKVQPKRQQKSFKTTQEINLSESSDSE